MKKKKSMASQINRSPSKKSIKIVLILLFTSILQVYGKSIAQTITVDKHYNSVEALFREITKQTNYNVICSAEIMEKTGPITVNAKNKKLTTLLAEILHPQKLSYTIKDKNIIISSSYDEQNIPSSQDQQDHYTGQVVDENKKPIAGVNIRVQNKGAVTLTDDNGNFNIKANPGSRLELTHISYAGKQYILGEHQQVTIEMSPNKQTVDEVVVVAYGTQLRNNITGAISTVNSDKFEKRPTVSASTALQGLAPGVTVTSQTGAPGGDGGNISIRGINSFGGSDNSPLVIIDGVAGALDNIDVNQIESVSILKDAASAAIYGSRAANGVILVTTKRAKEYLGFNYKNYAGWQKPTDIPTVTDGSIYMDVFNKASINDGGAPIYSDEDIEQFKLDFEKDPSNYDWQKAILQGNGFTHNHYLSLMANTGIIKVSPSISYVKQDGIIKNTDFERYTLRNNMDITPNEKWNIRLDLSLTNKDRLQIAEEDVVWNYLGRMPTNIPIQHEGGLWSEGWVKRHPVAYINEGGNRKTNNLELLGNLNLTYKPTDWLSLSGMVAPRYRTRNTHLFNRSVMTYNEDGSEAGAANTFTELTESAYRYLFGTYQLTANANKTWGDHNFKILAGASRETYDEKYLMGYRRNFTYDTYEVLSAGADDETKNNNGLHEQWLLVSTFGRLNYAFKNRYLLEANIRYDGTSRFMSNNRWAAFPSFSAGWRISEENFMQPIKPYIKELKIRGSWGKLGNQNIGSSYYPFIETLNLGSTSMGGNIHQMATLSTMANPHLRWEETAMSGIGMDAFLFDKLSLTFDWYNKTTENILLKLNTSQLTGLGAPFQNAAKVSNKGWELSAQYNNNWNDFSLGLGFNLSDVRNKIVDMRGQTSGTLLRQQEGYAINSIYGYRADGLYQSQEEIDNGPTQIGTLKPGDIKYQDIAGAFDDKGNPIPDGRINDDDKVIIGSTIPRYTYGINLDFGWKGIRFSAFIQGVGKSDGYLNSHYVIPAANSSAVKEWQLDYWTEDNPNASLPRLSVASTNNTQNSTFWMRSSSYLRLKNIHLGYDLPKQLFTNSKLKGIYLYANGQNLFTSTKFYEGYDPEINYDASSGAGVSLGGGAYYPQVKVYTFGVDIKF